MFNVNEVKKDSLIIFNGQPHIVLEVQHKKVARQGATIEMKLKNLITRATLSRSFTQADKFEEADIEKVSISFIYNNRGDYVFCDAKDKSRRFTLREEAVGFKKNFLKPNMEIEAQFFAGKLINIVLPIKVDLSVKFAPPAVRGNTASGATKEVGLETGFTVQVPLFINEGDMVRVNTETGEYTERAGKGK